MQYNNYQFYHSGNKFWRPCGHGRRLTTTPMGRDWCSLWYYNLQDTTQPAPGAPINPDYPGGYPPYTYAVYLASLGTISPLPPLPMYLDEYQKLLACAQEQLGLPYVWGGKAPPGFDCSGFIGYVYKTTGFMPSDVASYTGTLWQACYEVETPYYGDLVFWKDSKSGDPDGPMAHVAMYIGGTSNPQVFRVIDAAFGYVGYRSEYIGEKTFYGFFRRNWPHLLEVS